VADHLLVVEPGRFRVVEGNYDTYRHLLRQGLAGAAATPSAPATEDPELKKTPRESKVVRRKRRFPYRKITDLEADIQACEARIAELHVDLATPEVLRDGPRVKQTMAELQDRQAALGSLYEHWEEASELNG
jgi:ATP-binding cassette, subfamily F, member 3